MTLNISTANKLDANQHLRSKKVKELIQYCQKCSQSGKVVNIGRAAFQTSLNLLSNTIFSKDIFDRPVSEFGDSRVEGLGVECHARGR